MDRGQGNSVTLVALKSKGEVTNYEEGMMSISGLSVTKEAAKVYAPHHSFDKHNSSDLNLGESLGGT